MRVPPVPNAHKEPGGLRIPRNSQNEGVLPPTISAIRGYYGGVEAYNERSLYVKYSSQGVQTSLYESTASTQGSLGNKISQGPTEDSVNERANIPDASNN